MKKIVLLLLSTYFISLNSIQGQKDSLKLLAKIDKYKIYATLRDGKQDGNSIQDTASGVIQKTYLFLRDVDSIYSYIKSNNNIYIIHGSRSFPQYSFVQIIPISILKDTIYVDFNKMIFLPRNKWPDGFWEKDTWYCIKHFTFIDIDHVQCIEKCYLSQKDGVDLTEDFNVIYSIDYVGDKVTEISRTKIN